ncbi:hypothetical protein [Clostridium sp. UBA3887]|uniref:hypothetical protein n=1 Tax=Clostridium sp. UBA3887 TaxID=1946356 RepID=UPI0032180F2B
MIFIKTYGSDFMALDPNDFNLSISPDPIRVVLGMTNDVNLSFSNTSLTERGYNLSVVLTLPDGVSYAGGLIPPTSTTDGANGTIILTWKSIKDLESNEIGYNLGITLKSDEFFRDSGLPVPFDIPLISVDLEGTLDTMPRGNDDPGNIQITKSDSANFISLRYNIVKTAPSKIPKGAGLLSPITPPIWPYQYTLTIINNSLIPSTITLIDNFPNGARYLGNLSVTGPDSVELSTPTIITPSVGPLCQDFVTIDWGTVTLSPNSVNTIIFNAAIWDNYTANCIENSGDRISHMTPLQNVSTLNGASGPVQGIVVTNAMDATINKGVSSSSTDVGQINNYTLTYRINQYDDVDDVVITDVIGNGQTYNIGSASLLPVNPNPPINPNGTTTLTWNLGLLTTGTTGTITFSTTTSNNYYLGGPVSAGDSLNNNVTITGTNDTTITPTPDNSSTRISIGLPSISKEIVNYFYKDGSLKTSNVVAPGDGVEFVITYSSLGLTAPQLGIEIDEYAPLNMGPLTDTLPVTYGGTLGTSFTPITVSPNGLRWALGTVPGNSFWTANFIIPVADVDFVGINNNLAKLGGMDTQGFGYSSRDQVEVTFGQPNITFAKTVTGPDVNAIKAGETYTYSITISNPQNQEGNVTDAFEMDLTDVIPTGLSYTGTYSVIGTGTYSTPTFVGQNISMTILKLAPDESLTFTYDVLITPLVVSGQSYINNAELQRPYSQPDRSYKFPGDPFTASTTLIALGITMTKLISPISSKIGDLVTYLLQVTVPLGTTAYNIQVTDKFPVATQTYEGNATKDGVSILPVVVGNTVTFPVIPFVDASTESVTIVYAFNIRVVSGTHVPPFIENQINNATVNWDLDNVGTPAVPFNTSATLQVRTPNLIGSKQQRNVSTGSNFTSGNLTYSIGDIIQYRITLTNTGAELAFNTVLTDIVNPLLSFNSGSISTTNGSASNIGNTITWKIPIIPSGASATLTFTVTTLTGIGSDGRIPNSSAFIYNSNNNGFEVTYGPINTNTVQLVAPAITILKTSSLTEGEIGDDITYTITYTVPNGTIAYSPILTDILPLGQTYIGPATRQDTGGPVLPVIPTVVGLTITFPTDPDIDATSGTRTLTYTFVARITSATHSMPFQEIQTNRSNINWRRTPIGQSVNRSSNISITVKTPNITILKEQKNVSTGGSYTTSNISAYPTDIIYYRLTITSNGASPAYNVNLDDVLSNKITFIGTISGPTIGTVTPPGPSLNWNIPELTNGSIAIYEFQVDVNSGIGAGDSIFNTATSTYDSNDVNPITYNENSNTVTLDTPLVSFFKTANTSVATIGSTINYTLTVTIPSEVAVYNLSFRDIIPIEQNYVPGTFSGTPLPLGTLIASPNELLYTDSEASRLGPMTLIYTFDTVVISGVTVPPYTQIQSNTADLHWEITPLGAVASVSDIYDVEIRTPHINALKEQRLIPDGSFTTSPLLNISTSDVVEYRITLTNDGTSPAYNVVTTDILDSSLTYLSLTSVTAGVIIPTPGPGGTINWIINPGPISPEESEILVFQVDVNSGPAPGTSVTNHSSTLYDTLDTNPTTLGPALSNKVAFNYNNPEIIKTVDKNALFVGDVVNYTVEVTIPLGNVAYNVQLIDILPPEQSYNPGTLVVDNVITLPLSTNPLVTPIIPVVDATLAPITIVYTFDATINSITVTPQQLQINTATVTWDLDPGGLNPGTPQNSETTVYVTNSNLILEKTQSNDIGGPFVSNPIQTSVGDLIYYKLSITNPGLTEIFHVNVNDTFSPLLQIVNITHSVGAKLIDDNNFIWMINSIAPLTTVHAIVWALVLPGGGSSSTIPNAFTATFDAVSSTPHIEYGPITSNTVLAELPSLQFNKLASSVDVQLGDVITYTLRVTIPNGTIAYNLIVSDTLPPGQNYTNNASIGGTPVEVTQVGQTVTFPTQSIIDATAGEVTLDFTFDARVVTGNNLPPYTEIQTNNATGNYSINPQGDPGNPLSDSLDINVNRPYIDVIKSHSNCTEDTCFIIEPLSVNVGDIIRYKLAVTNSGASPAYNVVITDVLDPFNGFTNIEFITDGIASYDNLTRTVTWVIGSIPAGETFTMIFDIEVLEGVGAGGNTTNFATYTYNSNTTTPIEFGPIDTNEVQLNYPKLQLTKNANITNTVIGKVITYTITLTIPNGTLAYNVQLSDIIPVGQQYNNNATLNDSPIIIESRMGHLINFPVIPFVDATNGEVVYVYTFETIVVSANVNPLTLIDSQINESYVNWFIDPQTAAEPVNSSATVNVTNSFMEITKLQRNVSQQGSFTDTPINGYVGQTLEYSLTVTNTGPNPIYDLIVSDSLSNNLGFVSEVSVPIGILTHSGEPVGGFILWSFNPLNPGESFTAVFSVKVATQPTEPVINLASGHFTVTSSGSDYFETLNSNQVEFDPFSPFIKITGYSCGTIYTTCNEDIICKKVNKNNY